MPAPRRGEIVERAADLLRAEQDEVARLLTREEGKTVAEAKGEIYRAYNVLNYTAGQSRRMGGITIPSELPRNFVYTMRQPLGTVALITPWNFPIAIPVWKLAPALVAGNTVVIKPASLAPLSSYRVVEALHEAGIPAGVLNYVTVAGGAVGNTLIEHPAIRAVSFTGSCSVGNSLYEKVTRRKLRVQLEMGGKNPTIVLKDADLDYAADVLVNGAFFSTGQKCTACSRAIIEKSIYEPLLEKLIARTRKLKVGNGLEAGIDIGPAVDEAQLETDLKYIQ